jgi:transcriptional regulator with PAS, ATPase and Fis domain
VIERACILTDSRIVTERELASAMSVTITNVEPGRAHENLDVAANADPALMSTAQRDQITRVLRQVSGNKAAAAKQLGISRRSLYRWLDRLNIPQ